MLLRFALRLQSGSLSTLALIGKGQDAPDCRGRAGPGCAAAVPYSSMPSMEICQIQVLEPIIAAVCVTMARRSNQWETVMPPTSIGHVKARHMGTQVVRKATMHKIFSLLFLFVGYFSGYGAGGIANAQEGPNGRFICWLTQYCTAACNISVRRPDAILVCAYANQCESTAAAECSRRYQMPVKAKNACDRFNRDTFNKECWDCDYKTGCKNTDRSKWAPRKIFA